MIDRRHLSAFSRLADAGSFSRAARALGVGQPAVSKLIVQLEQELGATLFIRSTRRLALTEEGERALAQARRVLEAYDDLAAVGSRGRRLAGTVRVSCPNALASCFLIKAFARFRKAYPDIEVRLRVTDARLDLETDDIDLAVRVGDPVDGSAKARFVGRLPRIVAGGAEYLAARGAPACLAELAAHDCILVGQRSTATWASREGSVEVRSAILVDNHLALREAVAAGFGLGLAASFLFMEGEAMAAGLERVLPSVEFEPLPVNILYRADRHLPARTRALIDYLDDALRQQPWLTPRSG